MKNGPARGASPSRCYCVQLALIIRTDWTSNRCGLDDEDEDDELELVLLEPDDRWPVTSTSWPTWLRSCASVPSSM